MYRCAGCRSHRSRKRGQEWEKSVERVNEQADLFRGRFCESLRRRPVPASDLSSGGYDVRLLPIELSDDIRWNVRSFARISAESLRCSVFDIPSRRLQVCAKNTLRNGEWETSREIVGQTNVQFARVLWKKRSNGVAGHGRRSWILSSAELRESDDPRLQQQRKLPGVLQSFPQVPAERGRACLLFEQPQRGILSAL